MRFVLELRDWPQRLCAEKITDEELEELEQCMALQEYI